jgi:hypothetical protein
VILLAHAFVDFANTLYMCDGEGAGICPFTQILLDHVDTPYIGLEPRIRPLPQDCGEISLVLKDSHAAPYIILPAVIRRRSDQPPLFRPS